MSKITSFSLIFFLASLSSVVVQARLNPPQDGSHTISALTVRLPRDENVRYELTASGPSAFQWRSLNEVVARIEKEVTSEESASYGSSSTTQMQAHSVATLAIGSDALSWSQQELKTSIIASSKQEGTNALVELPCDVFVTKISRLEVVTPIRSIYVGEHFTLAVLGYDQAGNLFSGLEGITFAWEIKDENIVTIERKKKLYFYALYSIILLLN